MNSVHITLQGKGGVGKSYVSSLVTQYMRSRNLPVIAIDTDPVNSTLLGYKALDVRHLAILRDGIVEERRFDQLVEEIIREDCNFVVDNGASSFIPLSNYLTENEAISLMAGHGKHVFIHTIITGGQALGDTLNGFDALAKALPDEARLVVWLNEYFGAIEIGGKSFEELQLYHDHKDRIFAVLTIPRQTSSTFGHDLKELLDRKMTFDEVNMSEHFNLMAKSRLHRIRTQIFEQIALFL